MPELPEVETIKNELSPHIIGQRFAGIIVNDAKAVVKPDIKEFRRQLIGQKVKDIARRGKYLVFKLSGGRALIIHLRMTGSLFLDQAEAVIKARVIFEFDNGRHLAFVDRRRLGATWLVEDVESVFCKMGIEPLFAEFTVNTLVKLLKGRAAPIKAILLDQNIIAGIGNMYADEALFAARIHPAIPAGKLSSLEVKRLYKGIVDVLTTALASKGASVSTYFRPGGEKGTAHLEFKVAHRRGDACCVCGDNIQRLAIRGRGSYFCPSCQKK